MQLHRSEKFRSRIRNDQAALRTKGRLRAAFHHQNTSLFRRQTLVPDPEKTLQTRHCRYQIFRWNRVKGQHRHRACSQPSRCQNPCGRLSASSSFLRSWPAGEWTVIRNSGPGSASPSLIRSTSCMTVTTTLIHHLCQSIVTRDLSLWKTAKKDKAKTGERGNKVCKLKFGPFFLSFNLPLPLLSAGTARNRDPQRKRHPKDNGYTAFAPVDTSPCPPLLNPDHIHSTAPGDVPS